MGILPGGDTESWYPLFGVQFSSNYSIFDANIYSPTMHPCLASIPSHRNAGNCTKGTKPAHMDSSRGQSLRTHH